MRDIERALSLQGGSHAEELSAGAARLAARAQREGILDVAYASIESPFGPFLAAATARGLLRIAFEEESLDAVLEDLAARVSPRILASSRALDGVRRQLDQYFKGRRREFDMPLDWTLSRGFARRVLRATARIPYGGVSTYRDVARRAGNVRATRAAGNALGSNPIPIVVPCHRVLRTGGALGGYGGGLPMKEALLRLEGAR